MYSLYWSYQQCTGVIKNVNELSTMYLSYQGLTGVINIVLHLLYSMKVRETP